VVWGKTTSVMSTLYTDLLPIRLGLWSYRLQISLRHMRIRRRACCSASILAFNSEAFGPLATFCALGSSGRGADPCDFLVTSSTTTDKAASIKWSKNKDLSSVDGFPT